MSLLTPLGGGFRLEEFLLDPWAVDVPGQGHEQTIPTEDQQEFTDQFVLELRHRRRQRVKIKEQRLEKKQRKKKNKT